ncbi:MAG: Xaa-Pro peptidase family protein [Gemmataceae bacterium]|nr:Xaa-Pro peptidase family protein [Gemmataceae bacterium]
MRESFVVRRERLTSQLRDAGVDAFLVTQPINVSYLTGFTGEASYLIVTATKAVMVSDGRFVTQLAEECPDIETAIRPPKQSLIQATARTLQALGAATVEYDGGYLSVRELQLLGESAPTIDWKFGWGRVEALRQIKDEGEIAQIRHAIDLAERAFLAWRATLRPDDTEKNLADDLEHAMRRAGAKSSSFPLIVAAGARSALPHAPPTDRRLAAAPLLLVDWGACGTFLYKSDLTRVLLNHNNVAIPGSATVERIRRVYDVVLDAQAAALVALRPGVQVQHVDAAARRVIVEAGFGDCFTHNIGHGIGMMIHEAPLMKADSEVVLQPGMVVTVEPGIYLPGEFGIRIEDDILITPDGAEVLTHLPRSWDSNFVEL